MSEVRLRPAQAADAAAIAAIHVASWRDAYADILDPAFLAGPIEADRLALWTGRLQTPPDGQIVQVAESAAGEALGFLCAYREADARWGSLVDNLHVLPVTRGKRLGERLLRSAALELEAGDAQGGLHLWVFEANQAALRFYQRLGGVIVERDVSRIPAAAGKPVMRLHWSTLQDVGPDHQ